MKQKETLHLLRDGNNTCASFHYRRKNSQTAKTVYLASAFIGFQSFVGCLESLKNSLEKQYYPFLGSKCVRYFIQSFVRIKINWILFKIIRDTSIQFQKCSN